MGTMKMDAVLLSILSIIFLTVPATSNRCPRSTCTYNPQQWCSQRPNPCHCPCGQPTQTPSECNNGAITDTQLEEEKRIFPGMVRCPDHSCPCGETLTCLKQEKSCACTCVKRHQGCHYPWRIRCITTCVRSGPRCLCVCVAPLPDLQPKPPCCPGSGDISNQGSSLPCCNTPSASRPPCCPRRDQITSIPSSLPCCNTTQVIFPQASGLPCCQQNYGRH
uniref:TIL domain containing protein n=1 Tax=Rhipicephalus zambeziensis TaxID=60191 RepID=A0A224YKF6_9ACAR